jgi:TonB-like protein
MNVPGLEKRGFDPVFFAGMIITIVVHAGVLGAYLLTHVKHDEGPPLLVGNFVDAQLVKFGKPRDLTFLPHKQGVVKDKGPQEAIKVAKDLNALPHLKEDKPPDEIDPLKKTHANLFKNLKDPDQPEGFQDVGEGSPTGSRAGTATEAKGDPYILALIDQIGTAWTLPTTIKDSELANLSADVCLTILADGTLSHFDFIRQSTNSQFDSSLKATLGSIKKLPAPPDRFKGVAARGRLCPTFSKQ